MPTWVWVLLIVVAVVLVVGALLGRKRRRERPEQRFGPEYGRTVERAGGRRAAEADLEQRRRSGAVADRAALAAGSRALPERLA